MLRVNWGTLLLLALVCWRALLMLLSNWAVVTSPGGPWGPVGPSAPVLPVGPVSPWGPCGPMGPSGPGGPPAEALLALRALGTFGSGGAGFALGSLRADGAFRAGGTSGGGLALPEDPAGRFRLGVRVGRGRPEGRVVRLRGLALPAGLGDRWDPQGRCCLSSRWGLGLRWDPAGRVVRRGWRR